MGNHWTDLCWIAIGAIALYLAIFFATARPVAIRFGRLAGILLAVSAVRAGLVIAGSSLEPVVDAFLAAVAVGLLVSRRNLARVWLVRIPAADFRRQIETACRGLFLACEEPSAGRFLFSVGDISAELRLYKIGKRLLFIVLPPASAHGKIALLVGWLAKQYSGPVPRIRIDLRKGDH